MSTSPKFSVNFSLNQKGVSQIILLVLLVVGLVAVVYGVQYARTVMNPKAYENSIGYTGPTTADSASGTCRDYARCENNVAVIYRQEDSNGSCTTRTIESTNKSCIKYFCDDLVYADPDAEKDGKVGWWIHKYAPSYNSDVNKCSYAFEPFIAMADAHIQGPEVVPAGYAADAGWVGASVACPSEIYCDDQKRDISTNQPINLFIHQYVNPQEPYKLDGSCNWIYDRLEPPTYPSCGNNSDSTNKAKLEKDFNINGSIVNESLQVCKPGEYNALSCSRCNSTGSGWNDAGTDWGSFTQDKIQWCGCAKYYSQAIAGQSYDSTNYPQCFN